MLVKTGTRGKSADQEGPHVEPMLNIDSVVHSIHWSAVNPVNCAEILSGILPTFGGGVMLSICS